MRPDSTRPGMDVRCRPMWRLPSSAIGDTPVLPLIEPSFDLILRSSASPGITIPPAGRVAGVVVLLFFRDEVWSELKRPDRFRSRAPEDFGLSQNRVHSNLRGSCHAEPLEPGPMGNAGFGAHVVERIVELGAAFAAHFIGAAIDRKNPAQVAVMTAKQEVVCSRQAFHSALLLISFALDFFCSGPLLLTDVSS